MTETLATPSTRNVLPIPLQTLKDKLDLFAGFNHVQLQTVATHQSVATLPNHPVIALLQYRGRPELWDSAEATPDEANRLGRRREAYRYGVTVASSLLLRRCMQLDLAITDELKASDNTAVTAEIFDTAASSSRFLVSQFIETDEDVLDIVIDHMEKPALEQHMPWITGHEHDPGHRDYFHVGLGDRLAEFAIRHGEHPVTVPISQHGTN